MKSVMAHSFSRVPQADIQRSSFDRSHGHKTTFDAGYLVPVFIDEALPGDSFAMNMSAFARLATPIKPLMDNLFMDSFFFAVPIRLIWENWQKFNGEQVDPNDSTDFVVPQMTGPNVGAGGIEVGSLSDYFGLPTGPMSGGGATTGLTFNSLWHRAYNLIWNEWFRDQNLQDSVVVDRDNGPDTYSDYVLLRRGKRHDYFTSCLPWPQKGPDVLLPLGETAPIQAVGSATPIPVNSNPRMPFLTYNESDWVAATLATTNTSNGAVIATPHSTGALTPDFPIEGDLAGAAMNVTPSEAASQLEVDLSDATAATINSIREAFQVQRLYERDARGGTRYTEILRSHFGVISPDARLQRPEYLGGGSSPVNIHPVAQTSASPSTPTSFNSQGNLAGFGTASFSGHSFTKSFTEHCVIIGLVSVRADLTYQQGMNRMFSRRTRFDFFWPALANLGEQAVLNREIYCNIPDGDGIGQKDGVFGYQERYAEYRYKPSMITGEFRSDYAQSLDVWHVSQDFGATLPELGSDFIQDNPPIDRVIAVPSEPHFLFDAYFNLRCARPMPIFGVPGMVDHF